MIETGEEDEMLFRGPDWWVGRLVGCCFIYSTNEGFSVIPGSRLKTEAELQYCEAQCGNGELV